MSEYVDDFYAALKTVIVATWTDITTIYEQEQLDAVPWDDTTLPIAVILMPSMTKSDNWGATWNAFDVNVEIYYLAQTTGKSSGIRTKLEAMRDALLAPTALTSGQVLDVTDLCWSDSLQANALIASKNYAQGAGRVTVQCLIGEVWP